MIATSHLIITTCGGLLAILIAILIVVWLARPALVLQAVMWVSIRLGGMKIRYVRGQKLRYCYAERGKPQADQSTLVFVHGFSSGKNSWLSIIQKLPQNYHVIAVDLPGHGESSLPSSDEHICLQFMVDSLREILTVSGISERPIHLIGTSMGGTLVGLYAAQFPDEIDKLTLICPCVRTPVQSRYKLEYEKGNNALLPSSADDLQQLFSTMVYHKQRIPQNKQVLKGLLQMQKCKATFFVQLFNTVANASKELLEKHLYHVNTPTQVVWGANDEMIHVSGATMLEQLIPNCQRVDIVPECGHSIDFDQPHRVADLLVEFRAAAAATLEHRPQQQLKSSVAAGLTADVANCSPSSIDI